MAVVAVWKHKKARGQGSLSDLSGYCCTQVGKLMQLIISPRIYICEAYVDGIRGNGRSRQHQTFLNKNDCQTVQTDSSVVC